MSNALDISSTTARVASDLLKCLAILSDTTVRISAVDQKNLKSEKGHISVGDQQSQYLQIFHWLH